jgi:hypothetical protein
MSKPSLALDELEREKYDLVVTLNKGVTLESYGKWNKSRNKNIYGEYLHELR